MHQPRCCQVPPHDPPHRSAANWATVTRSLNCSPLHVAPSRHGADSSPACACVWGIERQRSTPVADGYGAEAYANGASPTSASQLALPSLEVAQPRDRCWLVWPDCCAPCLPAHGHGLLLRVGSILHDGYFFGQPSSACLLTGCAQACCASCLAVFSQTCAGRRPAPDSAQLGKRTLEALTPIIPQHPPPDRARPRVSSSRPVTPPRQCSWTTNGN